MGFLVSGQSETVQFFLGTSKWPKLLTQTPKWTKVVISSLLTCRNPKESIHLCSVFPFREWQQRAKFPSNRSEMKIVAAWKLARCCKGISTFCQGGVGRGGELSCGNQLQKASAYRVLIASPLINELTFAMWSPFISSKTLEETLITHLFICVLQLFEEVGSCLD